MREASVGGNRLCPALLALGLSALGCSTDTSGLARRDPDAARGGASNGPDPVAGSGGGGSADAAGGEGGAPAAAGSSGIGSIAVVHGLVDGGSLYACLREAGSELPIDTGAADLSVGVSYGQSLSVPLAWDVASVDVEVELFIAASASAPSCSELRASATDSSLALPSARDAGALDAGAAPLPFPAALELPRRAGSLRLAPGVLRAGAHYALVAAGCAGPGGGSSEELCGPLDPLFGAQQALVLAEISDDLTGEVGLRLQFLNASRAVSRADLVLQGNTDVDSVRLTGDVQFGAVRPENSVLVAEPLGLELHVEAATQSSFTQPWSDTLPSPDVVPGNYLLVYVGPEPGISLPEGVSAPRFVLVLGRAAQPSGE
jgi:hypothetical protein